VTVLSRANTATVKVTYGGCHDDLRRAGVAAEMTNLLITGSRDASPAMLDAAYRAVERAHEHGWHIVVGDARGVDKQVIYACHLKGVPFKFYGITTAPRNSCCLEHIRECYVHCDTKSYLSRDEIMVRHADRCLAIWDGVSRGTKYTLDYARKLGIQTDVMEFKVVKA